MVTVGCEDKNAASSSLAIVGEPQSKKMKTSSTLQVSDSSSFLSSGQVTELSRLFQTDPESISRIRCKDNLFSLLDIAHLTMMSKTVSDTRQAISRIRKQHPDFAAKCHELRFPGQRGAPSLVGTVYVVIEMMMLLPGKRASNVRAEASRALVHILGGNLELAEQIIQNRETQDELRTEAPGLPARVFGDVVEQEVGDTPTQRNKLEMKLMQGSRSCTKFDPAKLDEVHHEHKQSVNHLLLLGALQYFGNVQKLMESGFALNLDDFDVNGRPRTSSAWIEAGIQPDKILSPNREEVVVSSLRALGVRSVCKDIIHALLDDYLGLNISLAYLDTCSGELAHVRQMLEFALKANKRGGQVVGYTIIARSFTPGKPIPFTKRIMALTDFMLGMGFEPLMGSLDLSYQEYNDARQRVGTALWRRSRQYLLMPDGI